MDMCDLLPISPACLASDAVSGVGSFAAGGILDSIGGAFASAAESVINAVFDAISTTTTVDLSAEYVTRNAAALGSVALVVIVGLFVVQVIAAAIRREPGGLARAVTGAGIATLGTAAAAAVVQALLIAVDGICDGIAGLAGTSIQDAARGLIDVALLTEVATAGASGAGGALLIVFGLLFIVGAALTLGTLLVRQALIVIAVVVAPLALAGGAARITSGWVIRWVQVTLALILSKLAIVIVLVVAVGMVGGATGIGALLSGLILLLLASLAPWACFKVLDFAGTHVAGEWHRSTNGSTIAVANQGRISVQSMVRSVTAVVGGASAGPAGAAAAGGAAASGSSRSSAQPIPVLSHAWFAPAASPPAARQPASAPSTSGEPS
ncbi:hypothetical protein [Actinotalea fermentans]|uniref:Conjugal transfer protein TrbL n=1 Tax=Actinotalea fermentans TaxID=43671 RepID=A0A511YYF8_9CELL|nr:hypothetical protein [Actinotalea fermentans]KGM17837.1 hypothetical protein N867_08755 [Actinotalea fermentans ATCC 43279 = JCM 9966 = DSM 3133]GEN80232.1 hypothetical protein AFE02nite_19660 [Actinotalea fermentans]